MGHVGTEQPSEHKKIIPPNFSSILQSTKDKKWDRNGQFANFLKTYFHAGVNFFIFRHDRNYSLQNKSIK